MRVTMTRTETGSPDGIRINTYQAGEVYDVPADLAEAFLGMGAAEAGSKASAPGPSETMVAGPEETPESPRRKPGKR